MGTRRFFFIALVFGLLSSPGFSVLAEADCGPVDACPMAQVMTGCGENGDLPDCCSTEAPPESPPQPSAYVSPDAPAKGLELLENPVLSRSQILRPLRAASFQGYPKAPNRLFSLFQSFLI